MYAVDLDKLNGKVENLRQKMHDTAKRKGITHHEVLRISQLLDKRLNQYTKICMDRITDRAVQNI